MTFKMGEKVSADKLGKRKRSEKEAKLPAPKVGRVDGNDFPSLGVVWKRSSCKHAVSVFYRLPTEGYTQGGKFWVRRRRDQELEGAKNTKLRHVRATRRVIPYVLYSGLYCLWCRMIWRSCFERVPVLPYISESPGLQGY
jgi:hypothetical protein